MEQSQSPTVSHDPKNKQPSFWAAVGCGCFAILAILVLIMYWIGITPWGIPDQFPTPVVDKPKPLSGVITSGNTMGDPNAPVTIIEYGDYQCPYCYRFWKETEPKIIETYVKTGKVYLIYRSAGSFIGPESGQAAQAAYCAGDQGKFWEYHDYLYSNQGGENTGTFGEGNLIRFANALGLNKSQFTDCLRSAKYAALVEGEGKQMIADGVQATPSFLVNGHLVEGAQPWEDFQNAIEAALGGY